MKDAKGHGSDARGGSVQDRLAAARTNPNHPLGVLSRVVSQGTPIAGMPAHAQGVNQVGQWKHNDANGRSIQEGDRVLDTHYGNAMGTVTRTYFEGGDPTKTPLMSVKLDSGGGGTTVTRQPGSVTRYVSPEEHEYNRDLALRSRNGQVGSGMKFRG